MGRRPRLTSAATSLAILSVGLTLPSGVAVAQSAAPLPVELPHCDVEPFPYEEFVQILRAQLAQDRGPDVIVSSGSDARPRLRVTGACGAHSAGITMEAITPGGRRLRRNVPFHDLPVDVRGRGLAVVAAELYRAARDEQDAPPPDVPAPTSESPPGTQPSAVEHTPSSEKPRTEPPATRVSPTPPSPRNVGVESSLAQRESRASVDSRRLLVGVAAQTRLTAPTLTMAAGARAHARRGEFVAGLDWLTSSVQDSFGTTRGNIVAGWVGLVVWDTAGPPFWIGTSPRAGVGIAIADATPTLGIRGRTTREPYFDAAWQLDVRWELGAMGGLTLGTEAGVARGLTAATDEGPVLALGGWFWGARVGLEASP